MDKEFVMITVPMTLCTLQYGRGLLDTLFSWIPDSASVSDQSERIIFGYQIVIKYRITMNIFFFEYQIVLDV